MKKIFGAALLISSSLVMADTLPTYITECADCHGDKGVSSESDVPTIAGASEDFIKDTLAAYKDGTRIAIKSKFRAGDTTRAETDMKAITKDFTEEQMDEIAKYYSKQSFVAAKQSFDEGLAEVGKKVHEMRCKKCHEDGGGSADDDAGILAGQWTPYLQHAFKLFRSGDRYMEEKMKVKIDALDDKEVEALLNFYASQQ